MSKEENSEKKVRELKPEVVRIAGILKDQFSLDKTTGDITQGSEDSLYEKSLPEDLTMPTVKKVHGHDRHFTAALTQVVGELSLEGFKENKDLQQTNVKVSTDGRSSVTIKHDRKKEYEDRISNKGEAAATVVKFCKPSVKVTTSLGNDFNIVKQELLRKGKEALAE